MESKTLTFDWRVDETKPGHVEVWFREHPERIQRNTPYDAVSDLFAIPHQLVGLGSYKIEYPNGAPPGLGYKPPTGFTTTREKRTQDR